MRIGELSRRTGVSVRSIRHYDEAGLIRSTRAQNGYRHFPGGAVQRVRRIRSLIHQGFTLHDIRPLAACLDGSDTEEEFCERVLAQYEDKLAEVKAQITKLQDRRRQLADRVATLRRQLRPSRILPIHHSTYAFYREPISALLSRNETEEDRFALDIVAEGATVVYD